MANYGEKRKDEIAHLEAIRFFARDEALYTDFEKRCEAINETDKEAKNKLAAYAFCYECGYRPNHNKNITNEKYKLLIRSGIRSSKTHRYYSGVGTLASVFEWYLKDPLERFDFDFDALDDFINKKERVKDGYVSFIAEPNLLEDVCDKDRVKALNELGLKVSSFYDKNGTLKAEFEHLQYPFKEPPTELKNELLNIDDALFHTRFFQNGATAASFTNKKRKALVDIDFTKPLDEIIAFVTAIKNDFDKDPSIIPTTREILTGEPEPEPKPDTSLYTHDKKNKKKLWEKYADVLFIYDCKKVGLGEAYIRSEIDAYHQTKGIVNKKGKLISIADDTYKELVKMGKDYIDKGKYKEFLHG